MAASTQLDSEPTAAPAVAAARPPIHRRRDIVALPLVLAGLAAYFNAGEVLPVPGAFGKVDRLSGQATFNSWVWLSAMVVGFYFVFGLAGRFAFSTAAMAGAGAYASAWATRSGNHWLVGLAVAALATGAIGYGFALLLRRSHHFYFAVATLGLAEVLLLLMRQWKRLSGKSSGEISGAEEPSLFGFEFDSRYRHFYLLLGFLGAVLLVGMLIERSPLRRHAIAARDNDVVAETIGVDVHGVGIALFTLGSVIAGIAGSLFVHTRGFATPETFGVSLGLGIFVVLILGGMTSIWGALIGAWVYTYVPLYLERWQEWTDVIWGGVLLIVMIAFPDGLIGLVRRLRPRRPVR